MQTVPHFSSLREARQRLRESNVTVRSGTASSVYPLSSSTVSGTESPSSPRSIADSFQDHHISSVDPDEPYDDYQAFHTDDVSYRLRLLLSNNYFLPPAHSKPSPSDFASPVAAPYKKATKSAAPAFLDLFRVGKARSKPTTPPRPLTPASENSPFAFQASALRGLGVESSLGAAVLAERLPPGTPGVWSLDPDEEAWRKALLQEAVGHSLNNTPEHSFHTPSHTTTSSTGSMGPSFAQSSPSPGPRTLSTPTSKRNLGQRIVDILEEQHEAILLQPPSLSPEVHLVSQSQLRERFVSTASHASQLPSRVETPAEPHTALPPPPRDPGKLSRDSLTTESLADSPRVSQHSMSPSVLRKTSSSPMLHFWHDGATRRNRAAVSMTH